MHKKENNLNHPIFTTYKSCQFTRPISSSWLVFQSLITSCRNKNQMMKCIKMKLKNLKLIFDR